MKYLITVFITLISIQLLSAQESVENKELDSLYVEDQIYFSITYNILGNKLLGVKQNGFSGGYHLGFIKDIPINKKRNVALGIGLGISSNSFNQNLQISEVNNEFRFNVLSTGDFDKNRFSMYQFEVPFEFRWRTSTAETYNFWRIYIGFKLGYVFSSKTKFVSSSVMNKVNIQDAINKFQYGLTISIGYDSWNLHLYYALNTIFQDQMLENESIDLNTIKAGLIFYIL